MKAGYAFAYTKELGRGLGSCCMYFTDVEYYSEKLAAEQNSKSITKVIPIVLHCYKCTISTLCSSSSHTLVPAFVLLPFAMVS